MKIVNIIPEYEAMIGKKVSPVIAQFAEQMDTIGKRIEDQGREDAAQGLPIPSNDVFQSWSEKTVVADAAVQEMVSDLLRLYYMDGYEQRANREKLEVPA